MWENDDKNLMKALHWSEEEERPQDSMPKPTSSQEEAPDIPADSS